MANLDYNIAASAICFILFYFVSVRYGENLGTSRYKQMLIATMAAAVLDIAGCLTGDFFSITTVVAAHILNILRFAAPVITSYIYVKYVESFTKTEKRTVLDIVDGAVLVLFCILLLVNAFTGILYTYDPGEGFVRTEYFIIVYLTSELMIITALIVVWKNAKLFSKLQNLSVFYFAACIAVGIFLETLIFKGVTLSYFFASIAYMAMLFFIETPDFVKLTETMKELERAKAAAEEAKEEAVIASQAKTRFLANMSHEIRTPINAVLGFDEMILRDPKDNAVKEYAQSIHSSGNTLLQIINQILDFSKVESGKLELAPQDYSLSGMLGDICEMISLKAEQKGLDFELIADETVPDGLYGDDLRIRQVLINLLNNAVKYTDSGKVTLKLSYERDEKGVLLSVEVADTGIGMREEDLKRIFDPYTRILENKGTRVEGTGLGLGISRKLLELMGSELKVFSVYTKGSVFCFTLRQNVVSEETFKEARERRKSRQEQTQTEVVKHLFAPEAKMLAVDDTSVNLKVIKSLLKRTCCEVELVTSGTEAVNKCRDEKYDIILLDHMMPYPDGTETLRLIRSDETGLNHDTPVVVLTANAVVGAKEEYLSMGFDDYLSKPVSGASLEDVMARLLPEQKVSFREKKKEKKEQEKELTGVKGGSEGQDKRLSEIAAIKEIDIEKGIEASENREIFLQVLEDIADTFSGRADRIERFFNEKDYPAYTIEVHALKSTARLAGDVELSEKAKELEAAGREENDQKISDETYGLLEAYRKLGEALNGVFSKNSGRNRIDAVQLKDTMKALYEAVEVFDFDTADSIMKHLSEYSFDDEFTGVYRKLKALMADVARDEIMELINGLY